MRPLEEFLTTRELFVLQNRPGMTYKKIGEQLGVSPNRANQIKNEAERKIRAEKRREQGEERALQEITITLQRKEIQLIRRALQAHQVDVMATLHRHQSGDVDPDEILCDVVLQKLYDAEKSVDSPYISVSEG